MKIQFKAEYEDKDLIFNHCIKTNQAQAEYRPHYHDMYEILFLKEGDISVQIGSAMHPIRKNCFVLTRPQQLHCIRIDKDTPYDRYDLLFTPETIDQDLLQKIPEDLCVVNFDANPIVIQLFDKMDLYCKKLDGSELRKVLRALTEELLLNVLLYVRSNQKSPQAGKQPLTLLAMSYIAENLLTLPDVETVCRELGISRSYLYQLFQTDLNTTPKRFITECRLNLARQEIFLGAKATSVYSQCGFTDYSTFFRAYKRQFGYPPTGTHHANFVRSSDEDILMGYTE
jgi:AraC-like DNA-binding protein